MKVLVLGATGMLGHEVCRTLAEEHEVIGTSRAEFDAACVMSDCAVKRHKYFHDFANRYSDVDYVINAIGVTIPFAMRNPGLTFFVNSALPHILSREYGRKLIHITTDCAYSGTDGKAPYTELSTHSPNDIYGISKSLGEPTDCITLRTSIIGRELNGGHSGLLGWFLKNAPGSKVNGFTDHLWNGITTHQFALVCDKIMNDDVVPGLYHIFSTQVTKYDMLQAFKEKFDVDCEIEPVALGAVDRRLGTVEYLNDWLKIPTFQEMIDQMP